MADMISTKEAAKILGVSAQRVRDLCRAETEQPGAGIKGEKSPFGGPWMVNAKSVAEYQARPETRGRKPKPKN